MLNILLEADPGTNIIMWIMVGVIFILLVVFWVWNSRKNKKAEQESNDLRNSIKPGNKVKTVGGVCGIVVEVDNEENTFVLETGSVDKGKSYVKFDKQAIWQTDAVVEKSAKDKKEEKEEPAESVETAQPAESAETETETAENSENK